MITNQAGIIGIAQIEVHQIKLVGQKRMNGGNQSCRWQVGRGEQR
jgi:hypothetical protein